MLILPILRDPLSFGENVRIRDRESSEYDVRQVLPIRVSQFCFTSGNFRKLSFRNQTQRLIVLSIWRFQLRVSGEGIGCTILVTRPIVNLIVVVRQQLQPAHLSSIENTRLREILEILVVSEDLNWKFRLLKPVLPILKSLHNRKSLLIWYSVVMFGRVHRFRHEADRMVSIIRLFLGQDGSISIIRCISFHLELSIRVGVNENGSLTNSPFQEFEGAMLVFGPLPGLVLLEEVM